MATRLCSVYHRMSAEHFQLYVNDSFKRHNVRGRDTINQMQAVVAGVIGKRLLYREWPDE